MHAVCGLHFDGFEGVGKNQLIFCGIRFGDFEGVGQGQSGGGIENGI